MENTTQWTPVLNATLDNGPISTRLILAPLTPTELLMFILQTATSIIGLFFNVVLIMTISLRDELHKPMYILIVNLSCGDILFSTCVVPTFLVQMIKPQVFDGIACDLMGFLSHSLAYQSMYTLIFLSLDRYWAICRPMKTQSLRECFLAYRLFTIVAWILALAVASPPVFGFSSYKFFPDTFGCMLSWEDGVLYTRAILGPLMFQPGCLVMLFVYVNIFLVARRSIHSEITTAQAQDQRNLLQRELKAAKSILIIFGIFAIAWFPFVGFRMYSQISGRRLSKAEFYSQCLFTLPNMLNPVVYGWMNREFKSAFIKQWKIRNPSPVHDIPTSEAAA